MSTLTPILGLPRPVGADNDTLAKYQEFIDAVDAKVASRGSQPYVQNLDPRTNPPNITAVAYVTWWYDTSIAGVPMKLWNGSAWVIMDWIKVPRIVLMRNGNQSIGQFSSAGAVAISWNYEQEDLLGFVTVPISTLVIPYSGVYSIHFGVQLGNFGAVTGTVEAALVIVGLTTAAETLVAPNPAASGYNRTVSTSLLLSAGDSLSAVVSNNSGSGGAVNVQGAAATYNTYLILEWDHA